MKSNNNESLKIIYTEQKISEDLVKLGIKKGDVLLITADLLKVGLVEKNRKKLQESWVRIFCDLVGDQGTIILVSFTKSFFRFAKNSNICFQQSSPSTSGALSNAFLSALGVCRSSHPTNSIVAWGKYAEYVCNRHTKDSLTYSFIGDIAKLNGKHLMMGTIDKKNAPAGFHYAQELTGETKFTPGIGFFQTYYFDKLGVRRTFTRWDGGGCSGAGYKLLGHHLLNGSLEIGYVGNAHTAIIDVRSSVKVCVDALVEDRAQVVCDDKRCLTCRGRWSTSGFSVFVFYVLYFVRYAIPICRRILTVMRTKR